MVGCLICGLNGWLKGSGIRCFLEHNLITLRALFLFFLHFMVIRAFLLLAFFLDACLAFLLALPRFLFLGIVILIKYFFIVNGT